MRKIDLPLFSDVIFYTFCAFLASMAVLRYHRISFGVSLAVAILIALAAGGTSFLAISRKHRKKILGKRAQEKKEALLLHLALERPDRVKEALRQAFLADGKEVILEGDTFRGDGDDLIPLFTMEPVGADAVARILREEGEAPFVLLCNTLTPAAEHLIKTFRKRSMDGGAVFELFERTGTTPEHLICGDLPRAKWKEKLSRTFSAENCRPFFVSGSLLLGMSLFTLFPLYYVISGSVLLLIAVFMKGFGYRNKSV